MFRRIAKFARTHRGRERALAFVKFTWHRFDEDRCLQTAGTLAYTSMFALVPLTAAVLGILAAFPAFAGWREQLTHWVFANFVPAAGDTVQGYITQFANNASKATVVGILVLLFSAVWLMVSIEDAFNRIWRVQTARGVVARFIIYWAALTLGPLLATAALAISSYLFALPFIDAAQAQFPIKTHILTVLPFLIVFIGLVATYAVIPHCRVPLRKAAIGALIAALLFDLAKRSFALYAMRYASYQQVYGTLAIVPIFMLWVYLSWAIVLFGASITASLGAFDYRHAAQRLPRGQEFIGLLRVIARFVAAQRQGRALHAEDLGAVEPFLTDALLQRYLGDLQRVGVIQRNEAGGWVVVRDLASTDLRDLYEGGGYRIPIDAASAQGDLGDVACGLLDGLASEVREVLSRPLAEVFPMDVPSHFAPESQDKS
ncbi:MAG: virulence factor BrkB family protein [Rhodanobacter sp.]|jgi:membrane protein|nr:virulence factor BrkB family protein [Rhodanobacter sp.]